MTRDDATTGRRAETVTPVVDDTDETDDAEEATASPSTAGVRRDESLQSQLDVLTLLVAVVGLGLLLGGVAATFAALFSFGVALYVLFRLAQRDDAW